MMKQLPSKDSNKELNLNILLDNFGQISDTDF